MEVFKYKESVGFMTVAKRFGILSVVMVVLSLGLLFTKGLNYGIDFAGGTLIQVQYKGDAPIEKVRTIMSDSESFKGANVTFFGSDSEIVIRTKNSSKAVDSDVGDEVAKILNGTGEFEIRRVDMVGPAVGDELKTKGLMAMLFSILGILIYISFRFEWRFAVASIVALIHDISIAMGAISLVGLDVNLDVLAALLTLLGYSLNDTIIVFDRIREGVTNGRNTNLADIINESITRTLARTTLTSLTTFFVIVTLFFFGGEIIHAFAFTLLVGIVVGTYSSIFVASPILLAFGFDVKGYHIKLAAKSKREAEKQKMRDQFESGVM